MSGRIQKSRLATRGRRTWIARAFVLLVVVTLFAAQARAAFVIADSIFNNSNWPLALTFEQGDSFGSTNGQDPIVSSGNPGPYRLHQIGADGNPTNPGYSVSTFYGAATYNPAIDGAIDSIAWSYDWRRGGVAFSSFLSPAILQGGTIYPASATKQTTFYSWVSESRTLTAADFPGADFTSAGSPIDFGYLWNAGTFTGVMNLGVDNLNISVTATAVPEPGTAALFGIGAVVTLGTACKRRRRGCAVRAT